MTTITTVTSEGAVALPDDVRDALGLKPGSEVFIEHRDGAVVITPRPSRDEIRRRIESVRGTLKDPMTTDQIMELLRGD
jgi:AbrB family looped-hinge helix DNA binding protein